MEQVTVRAEQRFEDWATGEVRKVDRTRRIEVLIEAGHLTVIDGPAPVFKTDPDAPTLPYPDGEEGIVAAEAATAAATAADSAMAALNTAPTSEPRPTPPRRGRPARTNTDPNTAPEE